MIRDTDFEWAKFVDRWPHPPQSVIDAVDVNRPSRLGIRDSGRVAGEKEHHHGYFVQRKLTNWNGADYIAAANYRTRNEVFEAWVKENISTDFVDAGVNYTVINEVPAGHTEVSTGAHTDIVKDFTAIYLLSNGRNDEKGPPTVFWQEQGHDVYRPPQTQAQDGSKLTELYRVHIPLRTWVILEARVLHSVEHLLDTRLAFQISFLNNPIPDIWETKITHFRNGQNFTAQRHDLA